MFVASGMTAHTAQAEDQPTKTGSSWSRSLQKFLPSAKLTAENASLGRTYGGVGLTQRLAHLNAERITPYGIAYAKAGAFIEDTRPLGAQVGFRYPYHLNGKEANGYYIGGYLGHLDDVTLDDEHFQRLGAGMDLAYVNADKERISTLSIGIGAAQSKQGSKGSRKTTDPQVQVAYSLSFGMF